MFHLEVIVYHNNLGW